MHVLTEMKRRSFSFFSVSGFFFHWQRQQAATNKTTELSEHVLHACMKAAPNLNSPHEARVTLKIMLRAEIHPLFYDLGRATSKLNFTTLSAKKMASMLIGRDGQFPVFVYVNFAGGNLSTAILRSVYNSSNP